MAWKKPERFINSLDFQYLTNTIELDLSNIFGKGMFPSKREINSFIAGEMKVTANMLRGVQHHPRFPKVHVQLETVEQVMEVELRVKDGLVMEGKGIKIFGYKCDSPMVTIILNGQDMGIERDEVARVLGKYGTVVTCERGRNNDLSSEEKFVTDGTWTVRMTPKPRTKPPETVYYFGEQGQVQTWILSYDGVGSSCVLCGMVGHMGFRCNSTVPRYGYGVRPAGFGKWTDVAAYQAVVQVPAEGILPEGQVPVVGAGHGQGQQGGRAGAQPVTQEIRTRDRMAALDVRARQAGWGNAVPAQPPAQGGQQRARVVQSAVQVPQGAPPAQSESGDVAQTWETGQKKKRNRKRKKKVTTVVGTEVATANMFGPLSDEEEEVEDNVAKAKPELPLTFLGRSSMGNRYGSRKTVQLVQRYQKRKRMNGSDSKAKLRKKNPVLNIPDSEIVEEGMENEETEVENIDLSLGQRLHAALGENSDAAEMDDAVAAFGKAAKGAKAATDDAAEMDAAVAALGEAAKGAKAATDDAAEMDAAVAALGEAAKGAKAATDDVDESREVESSSLLKDISLDGSTQVEDLSSNLLASNNSGAGSTQVPGQSDGLDTTQPGAGGGYGQSMGLDGSVDLGGGKGGEEGEFGRSVKFVKLGVDSQNSSQSNCTDEHLEVKEKADAIKAILDLNKEKSDSETA